MFELTHRTYRDYYDTGSCRRDYRDDGRNVCVWEAELRLHNVHFLKFYQKCCTSRCGGDDYYYGDSSSYVGNAIIDDDDDDAVIIGRSRLRRFRNRRPIDDGRSVVRWTRVSDSNYPRDQYSDALDYFG